jgi:hypothetical protein
MRRTSSLVIGLVLPCLPLACGSDGAAPPDAARDAPASDVGPDAPPDAAVAAADRPPSPSGPDASADTSPPRPDVRPDYASSGLPAIAAIAPAALAAATATTPLADTPIEVTGTDFGPDAVVFFGGQMLATTRVSAEKLTATIAAALVPQTGAYVVQVESGAADARARSNVVYFTAMPPAGGTAPEIVGYTPDNGVVGDVIRIVGSNFGAGPLTVAGPGGVAAAPGAVERVAWNSTSPSRDAVAITLPAGWQTGPVVVTTPAGAYRGPIFWVASNLARLGEVIAEASSQYPSVAYFATSARDNNLLTAWYAATGNCALGPSCPLGPPAFTFTFPAVQPIARLAVRGLRDQYRGTWDYTRARFELLEAPGGAPVFVGSFVFPAPERDYDVFLPRPIGARIVRFVAEEDQSTGPGLSEIQVFPPEGQGLVVPPDAGVPDAAAPDAEGPADAEAPDAPVPDGP